MSRSDDCGLCLTLPVDVSSAMSDPTESNSEPSPLVEGRPAAGRRRLLQGGLGAAPVLMTLTSRPVLAQQCQTPSGFLSGNASAAGGGVACVGRAHGYWKNLSASQWPGPFQPTTLFNSVFNHPVYASYAGKTLLDVLELGGGPPNNVARDIVAALLNAHAGYTPSLSVGAVKGIWSEFITPASFSPSSGVHWSADDMIA